MKTLHGLNILITRPAHQAASLCKKVRDLGGNPILFSTIEIIPAKNQAALQIVITNLNTFKIAIFVSSNAVLQTMPLIKAHWPVLPTHLHIMAIGAATKQTLEKFSITECALPKEQFNSENLVTKYGSDVQQIIFENYIITSVTIVDAILEDLYEYFVRARES
jgi:uroporphyrinogen-III synthase